MDENASDRVPSNKQLRQQTIKCFKLIVDNVETEKIFDILFESKVLSAHKLETLIRVQGNASRCRQLLLYLMSSRHPKSFVVLRQALSVSHQWIVDMIDAQTVTETVSTAADDLSTNKELRGKFRILLPKLSKSVSVEEVVDKLISCEAIGYKTALRVTAEPGDDAKRWRRLMKALDRKSNRRRCFIALRNALAEDYDWLVQQLDNINLEGRSPGSRRPSRINVGEDQVDSKLIISSPRDSRHICHIRWNPQTGIDLDIVDGMIRQRFEKMCDTIGLHPSQIADREVAQFINIFIDQHGGFTLPRPTPSTHHTSTTVPCQTDETAEVKVDELTPPAPDQTHKEQSPPLTCHPVVTISISNGGVQARYVARQTSQDEPRRFSCRHVRTLSRLQSELYLVQGVAQLFARIYVICAGSSTVTVYDTERQCAQVDEIDIPGLKFAWDLVACQQYSCLFVSDFNNNRIWRINPTIVGSRVNTGRPPVEKWTRGGGEPWTISVTDDGRLLRLSDDENCSETSRRSVVICGQDRVDTGVMLPDEVTEPHHVVMSSRGTFYVSHGLSGSLHRVCEVTGDGHVVLRSYGSTPGSNAGQLNRPWHLAIDRYSERLFVVDSGNARVILLDRHLRHLLMTIYSDWTDRPWRLCYVPESKCVLVGTYSGVVNSYSIDTGSQSDDDFVLV